MTTLRLNFCCSELDTVSGYIWCTLGIVHRYTREWIHCIEDIVYIWIKSVDLPEGGFTAFWILPISLYISENRYFVLYDTERITG